MTGFDPFDVEADTRRMMSALAVPAKLLNKRMSSFAETTAAAVTAARRMAASMAKVRRAANNTMLALAKSIMEADRSAVDRLADLVREGADGD